MLMVGTACGGGGPDKKPLNNGANNGSSNNGSSNNGVSNNGVSNNGTTVADGPRASVTPASVVFGAVEVGASSTTEVTLTNDGTRTLEVEAVTLVEETLDDPGGSELSTTSFPSTQRIDPGDSVVVSVTWTPADSEADAGTLEFRTNAANYPSGLVEVPISTMSSGPDIWTPATVTFSRVPPVDSQTRDQYWQVFEVLNIGSAPLRIDDVIVSPLGGDFSVSFPASPTSDPGSDADSWSGELQPDESLPVRVYFNPVDDLPSEAELVIYSNDPDSSEHAVALRGNSGSACIAVSNAAGLDFGPSTIGGVASRTVIVENCSANADLTISDVSVCTFMGGTCDASATTFQTDGVVSSGSLTLAAEETTSLVVEFRPESPDSLNGLLSIESDDPATPLLEIPLEGRGVDNACPTAVAEARTGTTSFGNSLMALPLDTVELRGSNSVDSDGSIASYEWTFVQRPNGSTARLLPSATTADPSLFLDLAGQYVLELTVVDDEGARSCGAPARVTIDARSTAEVQLELTWDTPSDPDQSDAAGTDVDIHLLHQNGTWDNPPWDVFWRNPTADWGAAGPAGDPELVIDDTDGAGPEAILMSGSESSVKYSFGVYYYNDYGYGPSYATLRLYRNGTLDYELRDRYLPQQGTFWHAADMRAGTVTTIDMVMTGFPGSP